MQEDQILDSQNGTTQSPSEVSNPESERTTETINNESNDSNQTAPSQEEIDYKKRYAASSEEARRLAKERDQLKSEVETLKDSTLNFVTRDRQTFSNYLEARGFAGEEKQKYLSAFDAQHGQPEVSSENAPQYNQQDDPMDPYRAKVLDEAASKLKTQVEQRQMATQRFLENKENVKLSRETLSAIWPLAFKLETEDGLDPDAALGRAKSIIVGQDEVEGQSYARGLTDALFGGGTSALSGGAGGSKQTDKLSPQHEAFIRSHIESEGLEGKAAEDFRRRYVERLASKRLI